MAISSEEKCSICKFSCKSSEYKVFCKFFPKSEFLGFELHFNDPKSEPMPITSRLCVVCKSRLNYRKTHWKREKDGLWYSMCKECARNAIEIDHSTVEMG
jgi:hypothetical protein